MGGQPHLTEAFLDRMSVESKEQPRDSALMWNERRIRHAKRAKSKLARQHAFRRLQVFQHGHERILAATPLANSLVHFRLIPFSDPATTMPSS